MKFENLKNKILDSDFGITALITVPIFLLSLVVTQKILPSILFFIILFSFVHLWSMADKNLGIKRHRNIINSKGFQKFISKGFKVEKVNKYTGITGVYEGYICDIYYHWETSVRNRVGKADLISIYFTPPKPLHKIHCANYNFIMKMREKYRISPWSFKKYDFDWNEGAIVIRNVAGIKNPSFEKIEERIKIGIDILKKENLKPINREELDFIRANYPYQSVPQIMLYHK